MLSLQLFINKRTNRSKNSKIPMVWYVPIISWLLISSMRNVYISVLLFICILIKNTIHIHICCHLLYLCQRKTQSCVRTIAMSINNDDFTFDTNIFPRNFINVGLFSIQFYFRFNLIYFFNFSKTSAVNSNIRNNVFLQYFFFLERYIFLHYFWRNHFYIQIVFQNT